MFTLLLGSTMDLDDDLDNAVEQEPAGSDHDDFVDEIQQNTLAADRKVEQAIETRL
jgi:hypothetical protein